MRLWRNVRRVCLRSSKWHKRSIFRNFSENAYKARYGQISKPSKMPLFYHALLYFGYEWKNETFFNYIYGPSIRRILFEQNLMWSPGLVKREKYIIVHEWWVKDSQAICSRVHPFVTDLTTSRYDDVMHFSTIWYFQQLSVLLTDIRLVCHWYALVSANTAILCDIPSGASHGSSARSPMVVSCQLTSRTSWHWTCVCH